MKKLILGSLVGLLAVGVTASQAQYFPPATAPYGRPPIFPYIGAPGAPGGFGLGLYGGNPYGGYPYGGGVPFGGNPYNFSPYGGYPYGAQVPGAGFTGAAVGVAPAASVGLTDPNVTGHPTRFFNYSRYFFNQGGAVLTPLPGTKPVLGTNPIQGSPGIGVAPPRGKMNTTTGAK